jgi:hypothetical protein
MATEMDLIDEGADLIYAQATKEVTWLDCWHAAEALVKAGWRPREDQHHGS